MRSLFRLALLLLLGLASVTPLFAQQNWLGTTGTDWNNPLNWSGAVPGSTDTVWINTEASGAPNPWLTTTDTVLNLVLGCGSASGAPTTGAGALTITSTGNLTVTQELWVGLYADTVNPASWSTLNLAGKLTFSPGTSGQNFHIGWNGGNGQVLMTGNSLFNQNGDTMYVGSGGLGSQGLFSMTDNSTANLNCDLRFGNTNGATGGCSGTLSMSGNATIIRTGGYYNSFGNGSGVSGGSGYLQMSGNAKFLENATNPQHVSVIGEQYGTGGISMQDNTQFSCGDLVLGYAGGNGSINTTGNAKVTLGNQNSWYGWEGALDIGRWGGTASGSFGGTSTLTVYGRTNIGNESWGAGGPQSSGTLTLSGNTTMNTYTGPMRNYGWWWWDGGDVYVGCSEWENGNNATTQTLSGGVGYLNVTDYSTLTQNNGVLQVGIHSGTGTVVVSGHGTINDQYYGLVGTVVSNAALGLSQGYMTVQDYGTYNAKELVVGDQQGNGNLLLTGNGTANLMSVRTDQGFNFPGDWYSDCSLGVGRFGGTGTALVNGNAVLRVGGRTNVGEGDGPSWKGNIVSNGSLTIAGYAHMQTSPGQVRNYGWVWQDGGDIQVGCDTYDDGGNGGLSEKPGIGQLNVTENGSVFIPNGGIEIGEYGGTGTAVFNGNSSVFTGDRILVGNLSNIFTAGLPGQGNLTITDHAFVKAGWFAVGDNTANGTVTLSGAGVLYTPDGNGVQLLNGVVNLNGGTLVASTVLSSGTSVATLNLNGGTIEFPGDVATFIQPGGNANFGVFVQSGGVTLNTTTYNSNLGGPLLAGSAPGAVTVVGSAIGNVTLGDQNTYVGDTNIVSGRLSLQPGTPFVGATTNTINVSTGAALGATLTAISSTIAAPQTNVSFANNAIFAPSTDGGGSVASLTINQLNAAGQIVVDLVGSRDIPATIADLGPVPVLSAATVAPGSNPTVIPRFANLGMYDVSVGYSSGVISLATNYVGIRGFQGGASTLWSYNDSGDTNWGGSGAPYDPTPNSPNARAWFVDNAFGAVGNTCTLDMNAQVNSMLFYCSGAFPGYYIQKTGAGALQAITLSANGSGANLSSESIIQVLSGKNYIAPDIVMDATPTIYVSEDASLTITGAMRQSGSTPVGLTVLGGPVGSTSDAQGIVTLTAADSTKVTYYAGRLLIDNAAVTSNYIPAGGVSLSHGGGLTYTGAAPVTFDFQQGADNAVIGNTNGALTALLNPFEDGPALGSLVKTGSGTLVITTSDPTSNVYLGNNINVQGGTLVLHSPTSAPFTFNLKSQLGAGWGGGTGTILIQDPGETVQMGDHLLIGRDVAAGNGTCIIGTPGATGANASVVCGGLVGIGCGGASVGALTVQGNSSLYSSGELNIGDTGTGTVAFHDNAQVTTRWWFSIGRGVGGNGTVVMDGNSTLSVSCWANIGTWNGAGGTLTMSNHASAVIGSVNSGYNGETDVGTYGGGSGENGAVFLSDYAKLTVVGAFNLGTHTWAYGGSPDSGILTVQNHASFTAGATMNDQWGVFSPAWDDETIYYDGGGDGRGTKVSQISWLGTSNGGGAGAQITVKDNATMTLNGNLALGGWGGTPSNINVNDNATLNITGSLNVGYNWGNDPTDGHSFVNVNGTGSVVNVNQVIVGGNGSTANVWNQNAGHTIVSQPVILGQSDYTDGVYNWGGGVCNAGGGTLQLNGGTFSCPSIATMSTVGFITHPTDSTQVVTNYSGGGIGVVNFNGGVLQATANSTDFIDIDAGGAALGSTMSLIVQNLGAAIDTQGYAVTLTLPLTPAAASTGGLTKLGAGTLTLNAANAYTGNTVISAGKLQVNNAAAIPSGAGFGNVVDNGVLDVHGYSITVNNLSGSGRVNDSTSSALTFTVLSTAPSTFSGVIQDTGDAIQLIKTGSDTLILSGNNTYSGGTLISAGTLQLGNGGTTGSVAGNITDNAALVFNHSNNVTYAGNLTGSGSLAQNGTGTLTMAGVDSRTPGGVAVNAGTLRIGNGGTTGNVVGNVTLANNAILAFNRSDNIAFANNVVGVGGVTKVNLNTVTLTGTNSYSGPTTVKAGSLVLSGANAWNPVINLGGANIMQGRSTVVFDYSGVGQSDPTTIAGLLAASYNGGLWNTGKFQSSTAVANGTTLGWSDNLTTKQVTVMDTLPGDVNLDGSTDFNDLNIVLAHYNTSGDTWSTGDVNYDGHTDFNDLNIVLAKYNKTLPAQVADFGGMDAGAIQLLGEHGVTVVPEPGTIALLAAGLLGLLAYAWRKRN